jgi:hypothetical protein
MKKQANQLEKLMFQGRYQELLKLRPEKPLASELPAILGALSFTGKMTEARALFSLHEKTLPIDELVSARFFLALGVVRVSAYAEARTLLAKNALVLRKKPTARSRFYIHQGLAFYRYFCGRWSSGLVSATEAYRAALEDNFVFGLALSCDLRGHLLAQVESVDEGLLLLSEARELALKLGNTAVSEASDISILTYQAQYGLKPKTIVGELKRKLKSRELSDTYSRASLLLELARQQMLKGNPSEVKDLLDQAGHLIYMFKNRRQEAILNLRWAYLSFIEADPYRALSFAQAALRCLDLQVDRSLELAALGMQFKIVRNLAMPTETGEELEQQIITRSRYFGGMVHHHIMARSQPEKSMASKGDRLGRLIDEGNIFEIIKSGYWLLLYERLKQDWQEKAIWLDVAANTSVAFEYGKVHVIDALTPLLKKMLSALSQGHESKEELIEAVWGHRYDPGRHDTLIYTTITTLRRVLGPFARWIETTETGYRITEGLSFKSRGLPQKKSQNLALNEALGVGLNHRQLMCLRKFRPGEFIHVRAYQKLFQVAEITASRDLASLSRQGYVLKVGRARATRYTPIGERP